MNPSLSYLRLPSRDDQAEQNLLFVLVGFAAAVIATRTFLELTGYPQIASGEFHIAHVLWGGLLLFAAALLLLIWRGRRVQWLGSLLAGAGFGLFIDEVGKFITKSNDYFYPLAAPLIYAFFLLTVLIYLWIRGQRNRKDQPEVYQILNLLERSADPRLTAQEDIQLKERLIQMATAAQEPNTARLASDVLRFLEAQSTQGRNSPPGLLEPWRKRLQAAEGRWLNQTGLKAALIFGFLVLALRGLFSSVAAFLFMMELSHPEGLQRLVSLRWMDGKPMGEQRILLIVVVLVFEGLIGLLMLTSAGMMLTRLMRKGLILGYWVLLFSLMALHFPLMYFKQFEVLATTLLQFGLLLGILRLRSRLG